MTANKSPLEGLNKMIGSADEGRPHEVCAQTIQFSNTCTTPPAHTGGDVANWPVQMRQPACTHRAARVAFLLCV
eukprot:scaffold201242_cov30-Prasinocladus_malaysianus.AAC.1